MSLQDTLAARAAAKAAADAAQIQTGVESASAALSATTEPGQPPAVPPAPTRKELLEEFDTSTLAENTFALLGNTSQLIMPGGRMLKGDALGFVVAENAAQVERLEYFAKQDLCVRLK